VTAFEEAVSVSVEESVISHLLAEPRASGWWFDLGQPANPKTPDLDQEFHYFWNDEKDH